MLFQEKAAKELLEYNNRREGPILEGDERFTVMQRDENANYSLSLSRLFFERNFNIKFLTVPENHGFLLF